MSSKKGIDCGLLETEEGIDELRTAFKVFGDKEISTEKFGKLLLTIGIDLSPDELKNVVGKTDSEGTGKINFDQFHQVVKALVVDPLSIDNVEKAFKFFRNPTSGKVHEAELKHFLTSFGNYFTEENVNDFFDG